jgi:hypothetical protein
VKAFAYVNPTSEKDAIAALKTDGIAMPLAGGQDLLARMKDYIIQPDRVVNLKNARHDDCGGGRRIENRRGGEDSRSRRRTRRSVGCTRRPKRLASSARRRSATRER